MSNNTNFWLKIDYKGKDTYKVLVSIFERVFNNNVDCIEEIKFIPCENEIFIYANNNLEDILGHIYEDTQIEMPNKEDLIANIKVGIVGE